MINKLDGEYEMELLACGNQIKAWKMWYFKKNSKYPATIRLRCNHSAPESFAWKYFIELSISDKKKTLYQSRICKEAYDVLERDMPHESYSGIEIVILDEFTPQQKIAA